MSLGCGYPDDENRKEKGEERKKGKDEKGKERIKGKGKEPKEKETLFSG